VAKRAIADAIEVIPGGGVTTPQGYIAGGISAGIKVAPDTLDVGILASERPAAVAAMFTRSRVKACAVLVSSLHARNGSARAIVVNSGCSNVATGTRGLRDANELTVLTAGVLGIRPNEVLVGSTGIIGQYLPMDKIRDAIAKIELSAEGGPNFARAIITTDTHPKEIAVRFRANGRDYTIGACAKGSGMIHPDMATMFCWITTDAAVETRFLQDALRNAVDDSLNMISVDNDTSTSDTTAILANGAAGGPPIEARTAAAAAFETALRRVCVAIARMLARDGEGATKLIEVRVEGAASDPDAKMAARTVSASPLVKSAVHGNDPNWGRLLMAVGRSGARIRLDATRVWIGQTLVYDGEPQAYSETAASLYLNNEEVLLRIDLGSGERSATAWGCDLTPEYVHINSDYTT
jgi:glutamate N-acetyltransferase/amino-acid N-acetyltransferase